MTNPTLLLCAFATVLTLAGAQGARADPLGTPAMGASLSADPNPTSVDAGPLGKIYVTGAVSGLGLTQDHAALGDQDTRADISNAQLFVQKTDGPVQFFLQVGAYSLPSLGTPYFKASQITRDTYGVAPQAFLKFAPSASFNIIVGKLPTLIGAESTFTFENLNIERGLLWNQEPAVNRGIQANYSKGPVTVSVSLNDGFYSNRYNWVTGLVTYAFTPRDSLTLVGGGNFDHSSQSSFATPIAQNNGEIFNAIFTHNAGPLTITPYFQYTRVPATPTAGIVHEASTTGGAILAKYAVTPKFNVAARGEYISSTGKNVLGAPSLLYGAGSNAWSLTVTPTYQFKVFFVRAELSYTRIESATPGFAFGPLGQADSQTRGLIETGVLF